MKSSKTRNTRSIRLTEKDRKVIADYISNSDKLLLYGSSVKNTVSMNNYRQ